MSASPINLGGWHLTDDDAELNQWTFPNVTVQPAATLLVFASEKNRAASGSELHTNFKLDGDGEFLALVEPDGTTIAHAYDPEFPAQYEGVSYGLSADSVVQGYFPVPTPGATNTTEPVSDPARNIVISEVMYHPASNDDREEYIELMNAGSNTVSLAGWQFTSGVGYALPDSNLGAGQRLVIAADVAAFSAEHPGVTNVVGGWSGHLSDGGESITLKDAGGGTIDRIEYADEGDWGVRGEGPLDFGHTGWVWLDDHDGGGKSLELLSGALPNEHGQNWQASLVTDGTPGAANSVASANAAPLILDLAQSPIVPRASDPVTITTRVLDEQSAGLSATLHWRLDGDDEFLVNAMFDDGAHGDGAAGDHVFGTVIPAAPHGTVVEYYVSAADSGGHGRTYPAPVAPSNLQLANRLYQVDDEFDPNAPWSPGSQPIYRLIMTEVERAELAEIGNGAQPEAQSNAQMNATFIVVDGSGVDVRYNAGVRNRGHGSRIGPPNNYRVNLPKDRPWNDVSELNFNCRSIHSQLIGSAVYQFAGLIAADTTAVEVRVNGVDLAEPGGPNMFGSYVLLEQMNGDALERHVPNDSEGNLYSAFRLDDGSDEADLLFEGSNPDVYRNRYFKETNEEADDWSDLFGLTYALNHAPNENYLQVVSAHVNVHQWLRYLALDALLLNRETGLDRGIGDDYQLYRGIIDPRFVLIPHDLDTLMQQGNNAGAIDQSIFTFTEVDGLERFLTHPDVAPLFYQQFLDLIENVFNPETLDPVIDQLLGPFVPQTRINAMKQFVVDRTAAVLAQIPQAFHIDHALPTVGGFPYTTSSALSLSGVADAATTRSVLVNGQSAVYDAVSGAWSTSGDAEGGLTDTLIAAGTVWKYLDDGSNQGTAWRELTFDASGWDEGPAQLGYGDGDEATVVNGGPAGNRFYTTYFRHEFALPEGPTYTGLVLNLLRDDGAVLYLNGQELSRSNMPDAPTVIDFETPASSGVAGADEDAFNTATFTAEAGWLRAGLNVLAVEIHQRARDSSDISFDLELLASRPGAGTGGVPLQPGVNRVLVETFDGRYGTGQRVDSGYVDVWFDGLATSNVLFPEPVEVAALDMQTRDSFLPGIPFVVRIEALDDAGLPERELWDATVLLSTNNANVTLATHQVLVRNGVGSALVTATGDDDFNLIATFGNQSVSRRLTSLTGAPVANVAGTLPGAASSWSGVVHVTGDVLVPAGHTLTVQPGTLVLVDGDPTPLSTSGIDIDVVGSIQALGTASSPITFTAANPTAPWGEIHHQNAQPSIYRHVQITRAGHAPRGGHTNTGPAVRAEGSTITFQYADITDVAGKAMEATSSNLVFQHTGFARSVMGPELQQSGLVFEDGYIVDMLGIYREDGVTDDNDGIYIHRQGAGQTVRISRSVVARTDDDGIDTLGPDMVMEDLIIRDLTNTNDDPKGITIINGNNTIRNVLMANVDIGISAKGQGGAAPVSNNTLEHVTIQANSIGIQAEDKFGIPGAIINYNVRNSLVVAPDPVHTDYASGPIVINYSNLFGESWPGAGNLDADPLLVNAAQRDFRLQWGSPSVNAGDPASPLDADGSRADQGYYRNSVAGQVAAPQIPGGALTTDTVLAPWRGPYLVTGDMTVSAGVTLYVQPGTTIFFQQGAGITFNGGRLVAVGTEHQPTRFTRVPGGGNWDGLQFVNSMFDNRIHYAVLEYGITANNLGTVGLDNSDLTIEHATFDHADRRRIRSQSSSLIVRDSVFTDIFPGDLEPTTDNLSEHIWGGGIPAGGHFIIENNVFGRLKGHNDAIDFDAPRMPNPIPQILGNTFLGGGDDALDMTGDVYVEGNTFRHFHKDVYNVDPGQSNIISASGGDYFVVRNTFLDVGHVALVKEAAFMTFENNTVVDADLSAIYFDLAGQTSGPGRGARIVGSIFQDVPTLLAEVLPTTQISIDRSIVPAAGLGLGSGNTSEDARVVDPAGGDFALRLGSPALGTGPNGLDMGALVADGASIAGEPLVFTSSRSATLIVGGPGIVEYQYRLNSGAWSTTRSVNQPIQLSSLANGSYTVYVRGRNVAGAWQSESDATASRMWTVNGGLSRLVINEVLAANTGALNHFGTLPDVIELHNAGAAAVNLAGMSISDTPTNPTRFVFPSITIQPGAFLTLYADSGTTPGVHLGFGLDDDGDGVYLFSAARALVDSVEFGPQVANLSIARLGQDARWGLAQPTIGAENVAQRTGDPSTLSINEWFAHGDLVLTDDFVELHNTDPLPVPLAGLFLTDQLGSTPRMSELPLLSFVTGNGYVAFLADDRADDGGAHLGFKLSMQHETLALLDANGAVIDHAIYESQSVDVSQGALPDGQESLARFTLPTPGVANLAATDPRMLALLAGLRVTETMYNPVGGSDYEYVELRNVGNQTLDLSGVRLGGGIEFEFPAMSLSPGARVVVAGDLIAFQTRYGNAMALAGQFAGNLSNGGEGLVLQLPEPFEAAVLRFDYDDTWYPATDGNGRALMVRDETAVPLAWRDAENWQAGAPGGTPGRGENDPALPIVSVDPLVTTDTTPRLTGRVNLSTAVVRVTLGGATYTATNNGNGTWTLPDNVVVPALGRGAYDVAVTADDGLGHIAFDITTNELVINVPGVPGDTNGDGRVDLVDLDNVRNHFGEAGPGVIGDANGDQRVDLADLNDVRNNFGAVGAPQQLASAASRRAHLDARYADLVFRILDSQSPSRTAPSAKARPT